MTRFNQTLNTRDVSYHELSRASFSFFPFHLQLENPFFCVETRMMMLMEDGRKCTWECTLVWGPPKVDTRSSYHRVCYCNVRVATWLTPSGNPICFATRYDSMLPWRERAGQEERRWRRRRRRRRGRKEKLKKKVGASISIWKSKLALLDVWSTFALLSHSFSNRMKNRRISFWKLGWEPTEEQSCCRVCVDFYGFYSLINSVISPQFCRQAELLVKESGSREILTFLKGNLS